MTAAKVMDVIARLSECTGQAADAVSAYTQVKMEDAPKLQKFQSQNVHPDMDVSSTTHVAEIMVEHRKSCGCS